MPTLNFSPEAIADMEEIGAHIQEENPIAAQQFILKIENTCELIASRPFIGRTRDDLLLDMRSFPVGNYVIFYEKTGDGIAIVRVLHGARDLPALFAPNPADPF